MNSEPAKRGLCSLRVLKASAKILTAVGHQYAEAKEGNTMGTNHTMGTNQRTTISRHGCRSIRKIFRCFLRP